MVPKLMVALHRDPMWGDGDVRDGMRFLDVPDPSAAKIEVIVSDDQWAKMGKPDRIRVTVEA